MLLVFLYDVIHTAPGVDIPPQTDPGGRLLVTILALLTALSPLVLVKYQNKKNQNPSNGPTPVPAASDTPRLDATQGYLEKYVASLEKRVEQTEAKNAELDRKYAELMERHSVQTAQLATTNVQLETVHAANLELRDKLHLMEGQLRGRGYDR